MSKLDGKPVPTADLLFTSSRAYRTSDVARVGWSLEVSDSTSRTESRTVGASVRGSLQVGPVVVDADVGGSRTQAYTVTAGKDAQFFGNVPPVRNKDSTPEDESLEHGYGFSPIVYRDKYTTKDGKQGGYFVVTYTVSP
jgi:hypothetical protein